MPDPHALFKLSAHGPDALPDRSPVPGGPVGHPAQPLNPQPPQHRPPLKLAAEPSGPDVPAPPALTGAQREAIDAARRRSRPIRRAVRVAAFGGWSAAIMAALSVPFAWGSPEGMLITGVLGVVAWNEFAGGSMLKRWNPRGAARLGLNQLFLGAALTGYALWKLNQAMTGGLVPAQALSGDPELDAMVTGIGRSVGTIVYAALAGFGILVPGLTAAYYFSRAGVIRRILAATPAWAADWVRAGGR